MYYHGIGLEQDFESAFDLYEVYTARNAQLEANLLSPSRYQDAFASLALMITSLLQVVNRLAAICELHARLMQVVYQLAASLQISSCSKSNVHKSTGLIQLVGNLHQAGRIHNLHQVCGVYAFVSIVLLSP